MAVERVGDVGQSRLTGQGFGSEAEADLPPQPGRPVELGRRRVSDQLEQRDAALSCWEESEVRTMVRSRATQKAAKVWRRTARTSRTSAAWSNIHVKNA